VVSKMTTRSAADCASGFCGSVLIGFFFRFRRLLQGAQLDFSWLDFFIP
jgi:hypothetical protein